MTESGPSTFQNLIDDTDEQLLTTVGCIQDNVEASPIESIRSYLIANPFSISVFFSNRKVCLMTYKTNILQNVFEKIN